MQIRGYTLIEMCLVLSVTSTFLLLVPNTFRSNAVLTFEMHRMLEVIKSAKAIAIQNRETKVITIEQNEFYIDEKRFVLDPRVQCEPYTFHFNGRGNISMANSVTCTYFQSEATLVMNLGNGNMYVK